MSAKRRVCFVTGTRAEYGLMTSTLRAIAPQPSLELQIVVTGMHLDRSRGYSIQQIRNDGWKIDHVVPWQMRENENAARATGAAMAGLATSFDKLRADIIIVVGDRVEAFAAAGAAQLSGRVLAHVHGGDRAEGQLDDSLRHSITKLAHMHFAATRQSADRIHRMGEDRWRIHRVGAPGLDGIRQLAASVGPTPSIDEPYALVIYHPVDADPRLERKRAGLILEAVRAAGVPRTVIVYPNTDGGASGVVAEWDRAARRSDVTAFRDLPRARYLQLLRDASVLVGNSSSGIIEAASLGTRVVDIGSRQRGRERGANVRHVEYDVAAIERAIRASTPGGKKHLWRGANIYGTGSAGKQIARELASVEIDRRLLRKLIRY